MQFSLQYAQQSSQQYAHIDESVPAAVVAIKNVDADVDIDRLGNAIAEVAAHIDAATHRLLAMIRAFDAREGYARQGARSCAQWLSWRIGLAPGAAREQVRVACALGELPMMDESLRRGEISYSKVRAMTRVATAQNETRLLAMARQATGAELEKICSGLRAVLASVAPSDAGARTERWVRHRTTDGGMVRIEAQLHPDEAAIVLKALAEAGRRGESGPDASSGGDSEADSVADVSAGTDRSVSARTQAVSARTQAGPMGTQPDSGAQRADALVSIAEAYLAQGAQGSKHRAGAERTQLFVHLGPCRLDPENRMEATLQDGTSLSSATFLRLACDSGLVPIRLGDDGAVLDVGRRTRAIPAHIDRALRARDRTCRFPGCSSTVFVDAHHVEHWARGGETKLCNLLSLCRSHHVAVHEGGFRVERVGESFTFYTPHGRILPRVPPMSAMSELPGVPEEPLEALRARHAADGLQIHPEIQLGPFRMEPIDYDWAVSTLLPTGRDLLAEASRE